MKLWIDLTKEEAQAYLEEYVAETPELIEELRRSCGASGEPAEILDLSPESLVPLWVWIRSRIAWREGFVAPEYPGAPRDQHYTWDDLGPVDELPSWAVHSLPDEVGPFDPNTLRFLDMVSRYVYAMVVRADPGAKWKVGHEKHAGYAHENQPLLAKAERFSPVVAMPLTYARIVLQFPEHDSDAFLIDMYEERVASFAEQPVTVDPDPKPVVPGDWFELNLYDETGKWTYQVEVDELLAHAYEDLVARLVADLADDQGVGDVVHEDRERLLVPAPDLTRPDLEAWPTGWFEEHAPDEEPFGS